MFPKKLPPFLLRRGCGGQVGLVIHSACATDDTFRGPRSTVFRAAPPYSHLRERHCLYFSQKLPPFLLRRGCGGQVGPVIHSACAADDTFRGPRSLKRSCPTLRVVLVSKDHARHCVSCSSQKTMPDTACRARLRCPVRLRRTRTFEKGIVYCFTKSGPPSATDLGSERHCPYFDDINMPSPSGFSVNKISRPEGRDKPGISVFLKKKTQTSICFRKKRDIL